eukprot:895047-Heterocapsa_arctica.AAC.1
MDEALGPQAAVEAAKAAQEDTSTSLGATISQWERLGAEKDEQIADLNAKLTKMTRDRAALEENIAQKRREIEGQVAEERAALDARIAKLEADADNAREVADGMDKVSGKLTQEL